jgi:hypothetical protein
LLRENSSISSEWLQNLGQFNLQVMLSEATPITCFQASNSKGTWEGHILVSCLCLSLDMGLQPCPFLDHEHLWYVMLQTLLRYHFP